MKATISKNILKSIPFENIEYGKIYIVKHKGNGEENLIDLIFNIDLEINHEDSMEGFVIFYKYSETLKKFKPTYYIINHIIAIHEVDSIEVNYTE